MPLGLSQCRNLEILHLGKKEVEVEVEVKEIKDIDKHLQEMGETFQWKEIERERERGRGREYLKSKKKVYESSKTRKRWKSEDQKKVEEGRDGFQRTRQSQN